MRRTQDCSAEYSRSPCRNTLGSSAERRRCPPEHRTRQGTRWGQLCNAEKRVAGRTLTGNDLAVSANAVIAACVCMSIRHAALQWTRSIRSSAFRNLSSPLGPAHSDDLEALQHSLNTLPNSRASLLPKTITHPPNHHRCEPRNQNFQATTFGTQG
jgi:hypothetical protein